VSGVDDRKIETKPVVSDEKLIKNKNNFKENRQCTKCLDILPLNQFYTKGKRTDSSCKKCKRKQTRTTYVSKKNPLNLTNLKEFVNLIYEIELSRLRKIENELNEIIRRKK